MHRTLGLILALFFAVSIYAFGQQSPPPDILTSQTAAAVSLTAYKSWLEGQVASLWTGLGQDQTNVSTLQATVSTQATQITSLQTQLTAQGQLIQQLQQAVASLSVPAPTSMIVTFSGMADGPLNGIGPGGVNFGTGFWCVKSGELMPCADGMPNRSMTFLKPVTITSFTFTSIASRTTGLMLTSASGQQAQELVSATNQDTAFSPGWSTPTISFTVSALPTSGTGNATDLRIRTFTYQ
jgi:hypothetical protein